MVEHVLVDTSFLVALFNVEDEHHAKASQIHAELLKRLHETRLVFTDYIFDETMTVMKCRGAPMSIVGRSGDMLLSSKYFHVVPVSDTTFRAAWSMMKRHEDKGWSFTDCTSFAVMKDLGIAAHLSFDTHFAQAGFHAWMS